MDDHRMIRTSIVQTVEKSQLCTVVGQAEDARAAIEKATSIPELDLVLMDQGLPGMSGAEATSAILAVRPELKIIALTMYEDAESLTAMIRAGACSYVPKRESEAELFIAIKEAMEGRTHFPPGASAAIMAMIRTPTELGGVKLTKRELETLRFAAEGYSVGETASAMKVEESTVRGYRKSLGHKIGGSGARALREFYQKHVAA